MPVMADDGPPDPVRQPIAGLFLLGRLTAPLRALVLLVVLALCAVAAQGALLLQHHFAQAGGGRIARLLAAGPTAATAWTGWAAAVFFGVAVFRLRRGAPEPPAGRVPVESMTLPQMRTGLLREYTVVRAGLVAISLVAVLDLARMVRYALAAASGDPLAGGVMPAAVVEAVGLVIAAAVLGCWAFSFRQQLLRLGALR
jgi:hypothetical protein